MQANSNLHSIAADGCARAGAHLYEGAALLTLHHVWFAQLTPVSLVLMLAFNLLSLLASLKCALTCFQARKDLGVFVRPIEETVVDWALTSFQLGLASPQDEMTAGQLFNS